MPEFLSAEILTAIVKVVMIDVALAGDNAIVIAMAAASLPPPLRRKAILFGIGAATVLRILFASITVHILAVVGLSLAGGILLLWVCWKMWRELQPVGSQGEGAAQGENGQVPVAGKTLPQAVFQIIVADVSMSLDNVLAVAGASREHPVVLIFGLMVSIALMGFAATIISGLLQRFRWISYFGLAVILYVSLEMIYSGSHEVWGALLAGPG